MTHSATLLILDGLAVYRLTRLIVADTITVRLRERASGLRSTSTHDIGGERLYAFSRPRLAEFITCPWCVSPWLAAVVVACQTLAAGVWLYVACVLAFSAVAGILSERI